MVFDSPVTDENEAQSSGVVELEPDAAVALALVLDLRDSEGCRLAGVGEMRAAACLAVDASMSMILS